ncbi:PCNA-associated factor-like [Pararge aegeria]|uniref:PCNA-associated factor n=2 Tax=Pararge aegeria TaxID=116150 RepID=A0A8S4QLW7_9NEOP|nr:PCNA-associated factor-like [Pararge aegeria]CAH2211289.1 jg25914 [Pararge aegeria aegeria]
MARTRASVAAKVATGKSSKARCSAAPPPSSTSAGSSSDKSSRSYSGGNTVCPRETPKWQKPITNFFIQNQAQTQSDEEDTAQAGSSKSKPKRNIIHSDDEEEQADKQTDIPINKELDETIELEELTGEDSHKMDEYYVSKDKGKGKKSKKDTDKENKDSNVTRNKRHLDELNEEDERNDKKIKLD